MSGPIPQEISLLKNLTELYEHYAFCFVTTSTFMLYWESGI
jgi:hypothetical protein